MGDTIVEVLLAVFIFGIPAAALAIRFVLRPMLKDVAEAVRSTRGLPSDFERRLAELEENQRLTNEQLSRLIEAERFREQLGSGPPSSS